jgi:hypothetical protein
LSEAYERLKAEVREAGIEIDPLTNDPGWDGLLVDYPACVAALGVVDGLR